MTNQTPPDFVVGFALIAALLVSSSLIYHTGMLIIDALKSAGVLG